MAISKCSETKDLILMADLCRFVLTADFEIPVAAAIWDIFRPSYSFSLKTCLSLFGK
jgi:hypothetical protein